MKRLELINPWWWFFKKFLFGFAIGLMIRFSIAVLLREDDVSIRGFFNTGLIAAVAYTALTYYVVML